MTTHESTPTVSILVAGGPDGRTAKRMKLSAAQAAALRAIGAGATWLRCPDGSYCYADKDGQPLPRRTLRSLIDCRLVEMHSGDRYAAHGNLVLTGEGRAAAHA
jgi:hypothetical protein